jgi:hypothetical protein
MQTATQHSTTQLRNMCICDLLYFNQRPQSCIFGKMAQLPDIRLKQIVLLYRPSWIYPMKPEAVSPQ